MYVYCLMNYEQRQQLNELLKTFNLSDAKDKYLFEVSFKYYPLRIFERPSQNTLCVERKVLKGLQDPWLAEQVIQNSFGSRTVELVPREIKS